MLFVTGAPGAGKSAVAEALLELEVDALVFDGECLLESASDLAGGPIRTAPDLWPAYDKVWVAILEMLVRNRRTAVLFTPMDSRSLPPLSEPDRVAWCLLDCDDETRTGRLEARGWDSYEIEDALSDAQSLRDDVDVVVDTSDTEPSEAAALVADWVNASMG
jgi:broad-specificity NMP kinase